MTKNLQEILYEAYNSQEDKNDNETIVTLGYYLQLLLLKSYFLSTSNPLSYSLLQQLYELDKVIQYCRNESFGDLLAGNARCLFEIKKEVFNNEFAKTSKWAEDFFVWTNEELGRSGYGEALQQKKIHDITRELWTTLKVSQENQRIIYSFVLLVFSPDLLIAGVEHSLSNTEQDLGGWSIEELVAAAFKEKCTEDSTIVEFGSGRGSAELLKYSKLASIEHDPIFFILHGIKHLTYYAPLENGWYRKSSVEHCLTIQRPDIILVDGPPDKYRINLLKNLNLFENFTGDIVFDDVDRPNDEKLCIDFCEKMNYHFKTYEGIVKKFAWCTSKNKPNGT